MPWPFACSLFPAATAGLHSGSPRRNVVLDAVPELFPAATAGLHSGRLNAFTSGSRQRLFPAATAGLHSGVAVDWRDDAAVEELFPAATAGLHSGGYLGRSRVQDATTLPGRHGRAP